MGHSHHEHHDNTPLGIIDIIAGAIIFYLLAEVAFMMAGPEGIGFLKNLLTPERYSEMLFSGFLFLAVWYFVGELVAKPYLNNHIIREDKTVGTQQKSLELKREIEQLKLDIVSELRTARLEGVRRRDDLVAEAKRKAQEIVDAGRVESEREWERVGKDLDRVRSDVFSSLDKEVPELTSAMYQKVVSSQPAKTIHSVMALIAFGSFLVTDHAFAAGAGSHNAGIETLFYPTLNFMIYCIIVVMVYRKFARPVLRNYRAEVESFAVRAQNEFVTLERELEQVRYSLENVSEEKAELISELEKSGQDISREVVATAEEKVRAIKKDVLLRTESERQKIIQSAKEELVGKVMVQVKDNLSKNYTEEEDKMLIRSALLNSDF